MTNISFEKTIQEFYDKLPKFTDERIDYSDSDTAPVLTCFVKYEDKILLLKRSDKVRVYQGLWNSVAGYLDGLRPLEEKVYEELREELGISIDIIQQIKFGQAYKLVDDVAQKTWIIFPVLVDLSQEPVIKLDWEHTEYRWVNPCDLKNFNIVPGLDKNLAQVFNL